MDSTTPICSFGSGVGPPQTSRHWPIDSRFPDGSYYRSEMKEIWTYTNQPTSTEMMQMDQPSSPSELASMELKYPHFQRQRSNDSSMMGISPVHFSQPLAQYGVHDIGPRAKDAKRTRQQRNSTEFSESDYEDVSTSLKKVRLPMPEMISIRVKTLTGRTLPFDCEYNSIVLHLKHRIEEALGVAASEQRLLLGGISLTDYKPLSEYNVADGSVIYMVVSLHGG